MNNIYAKPHQAGSAVAIISLQKIKENLREIKKRAPSARYMPVLKANAYGLGAKEIACALSDEIDGYFVATPAEAMALKSFFTAPLSEIKIFILHGFLPQESNKIAKSGLIPVINTLEQAKEWSAHHKEKPCAIQIDSGMSRFGFPEAELGHPIFQKLKIILVLSHLACAGNQKDPANQKQLAAFLNMSDFYFPHIPKSISASEGVSLGEAFHLDVIRPGIALYGSVLLSETSFLKNAVSLKAPVFQISEYEAGTSFGYGQEWISQRKTISATLGIGYADCCLSSRNSPEKILFWKNGVSYPVIGRVSMDSVMIDITDHAENIRVGDFMTLLGEKQPLAALAANCGITPHEVLTSIGKRVLREYV